MSAELSKEANVAVKQPVGDWQLIKRFLYITVPYHRALAMVFFMYFMNAILNLIPAVSIYFVLEYMIEVKVFVSWFGEIPFNTLLNNPQDHLLYLGIFAAVIMLLILIANVVGVLMWRMGTRVTQRFLLDIKRKVHMHLHK